ncbi:RNA polymerase II C-terminal domain kinase beta subunit [Coemansia aciculifera]|uniref:RNA polymerase II C-terminal domain kinase beta subunit n=1 Tax=Coemansia aciculifera TaxID=417176 RepID=A0A9W8IC71_9FUNG|nr:RNA polymerase II C-terminal domain kinase beta subunit [Coemansia aciculifera]KAJ2869163.1 RNA polymerase II C-terminal domain kinase beta subunit [Coemansia aciculifera]
MSVTRMEPITTDRHTFMSRSHIVSMLNSSGAAVPQSNSEHHELLDHPAMITAARSCVFVKEVARSMGFPARTIGTAQLLIHRTYIYRSTPPVASSDLAIACLFVAAKMEETIKRLRDILAHSYVNSLPDGARIDVQSVPTAVTDKMRPSVLAGEQYVMGAIGFDFRTTHAHLLYVKLAKLAGVPKANIAADGWTILSDSYFTTLPVQYPSLVIAAGALCLAWNLCSGTPRTGNNHVFQLFDKSLAMRDGKGGRRGANGSAALPRRRPMSLELNSDWWLDFGVTTEDIQGFVRQIADFYLLFFNSTVASAEYIERHKNGLPSKEMSQKIGQWRMQLCNSTATPISP